ncbi:MAG: transcription-repair coupling factor, partial [Thermus sp.]
RIPETYIPSLEKRSLWYGRISEAKGLGELSRLERRLRAEYGPLPEEAQRFFALERLKRLAQAKGVLSITEELLYLQIVFSHWPLDYDAQAFKAFPHRLELTQYPPGLRLVKKGLSPDQYPEVLAELLYLFKDR